MLLDCEHEAQCHLRWPCLLFVLWWCSSCGSPWSTHHLFYAVRGWGFIWGVLPCSQFLVFQRFYVSVHSVVALSSVDARKRGEAGDMTLHTDCSTAFDSKGFCIYFFAFGLVSIGQNTLWINAVRLQPDFSLLC